MDGPARCVVVTGVTSFVGLHLARRFAADGWRVTATTRRPAASYGGVQAQRLAALPAGVERTVLDIEDAAAVAALVGEAAPQLWIHHAGHAAGYASADYNLKAGFEAGALALPGLYAALAGHGCGVILTGSSAEYAPSSNANVEDEAGLPDMPYGLAKLAATILAAQLSSRHGVATRVARLFIPFGALDNPGKLLAQVIDALATGRPVDLSPCEQARDFIGVGDVGEAYLALARDMPRTGFDILNVCAGTPTVLRDLLTAIATRMGADPRLLRFGARPMRLGEPAVSFGANQKAKDLLGWSPAPLETAVERDLLGYEGRHDA